MYFLLLSFTICSGLFLWINAQETPLFTITKITEDGFGKVTPLRVLRKKVITSLDAKLVPEPPVPIIVRGRLVGQWRMSVQELINDKTIGGLKPGDIVEEGIFHWPHFLLYVGNGDFIDDMMIGSMDTRRGGLAGFVTNIMMNETDHPFKNMETKSRIFEKDLSSVTGKPFRLNNRAMSLLPSNTPDVSITQAKAEVSTTSKKFDLKHSCEHAVNAFVFNRYYSFLLDADQKYREAIKNNELRELALQIELVSADGNFTEGQVPYIDVMDQAGNSLACDALTKSFRERNDIKNTLLDIIYGNVKKTQFDKVEDMNKKMADPDPFVLVQSGTRSVYRLKATIRTWNTARLWITVGKDRESKLTSYLVHVNDYIDGVKSSDKKETKGMQLIVGSDNPPEVKYVKLDWA
ncbi:hypothetical protein Ddc_22179 [Ditylenchus destructor]|nr:hypothetical protein Ddc_22179 [Ditylenchus destructor]